jgi:hypothetical protein
MNAPRHPICTHSHFYVESIGFNFVLHLVCPLPLQSVLPLHDCQYILKRNNLETFEGQFCITSRFSSYLRFCLKTAKNILFGLSGFRSRITKECLNSTEIARENENKERENLRRSCPRAHLILLLPAHERLQGNTFRNKPRRRTYVWYGKGSIAPLDVCRGLLEWKQTLILSDVCCPTSVVAVQVWSNSVKDLIGGSGLEIKNNNRYKKNLSQFILSKLHARQFIIQRVAFVLTN